MFYAVFFENSLVGGVSLTKTSIPTWAIFFKDDIKPYISLSAIYIFLNHIFSLNIEKLEAKLKKTNKSAYRFNKFFGIEITEYDARYYLTKITKSQWIDHKQKLKIFNRDIQYQFIV